MRTYRRFETIEAMYVVILHYYFHAVFTTTNAHPYSKLYIRPIQLGCGSRSGIYTVYRPAHSPAKFLFYSAKLALRCLEKAVRSQLLSQTTQKLTKSHKPQVRMLLYVRQSTALAPELLGAGARTGIDGAFSVTADIFELYQIIILT